MSDRIYGLLGNKLGHSWSVPIHHMLGCDSYRLIELDKTELSGFLKNRDLGAVNVTIPYKREVLAYCDVVDETAAAIGSANTLVRRDDGRLYAYNTDPAGFCCMADAAGIELTGRKVLILGSGGTSRTAQAVARQKGAREIVVISRAGKDNYQTLAAHADAEILVNTTPVGMFPDNGAAPVDLALFSSCQGVLEVIYNPRRTALLMQAESLGLPCSDGLPMLVAQAVRAEQLFFDRIIPNGELWRILRELRRDMTNIVLIGMPGCGKTTVGTALARATGREAIDIDQRIEQRTGLSVSDFFAQYGEPAFRALEREETAAAGKLSGKLILTGGGVVRDPRNYTALHQNGWICHLLRAVEQLPTDGRPLSHSTDLFGMWAERKPLYEGFRDVAIENSGPIGETVAAVWRSFCEYSGH